MVPDVGVGFGGHARVVQYPASTCVRSWLCGHGLIVAALATSKEFVVGHAVQEEAAFTSSPMASRLLGHAARIAQVGMEVGQPSCAAHAFVTARMAGWRAVAGCVTWSVWNPMEAFSTPVR